MLAKLTRGLRRHGEDTPRPSSPLEFSDGPIRDLDHVDFGHRPAPPPTENQRQAIEALDLAPLVSPFLRRMRPTVATREALLAGPDRDRSLSVGDAARAVLDRRPSAAVLAGTPGFALALLHNGPVPGMCSTPTEERENPFDTFDPDTLPITPLPTRPAGQRRVVSERGRRDMPLRVQAIRRAHQTAFAFALAERMNQEARAYAQDDGGLAADPYMPESDLWRRRNQKGLTPSTMPAPNLRRSPPEDEPGDFYFGVEPSNTFGEYTLAPREGAVPSPEEVGPRDETPTPSSPRQYPLRPPRSGGAWI